ncbi:hypothetical protein [Dyadobacter fermentans]|uniref:hypothetical protein n=1 Tax=Dyadobacter fermentans TaxID=94254 RepID=UPI001CBE94AE|nr:hypothetical protein [Dyadobacter fermentans]MBZ1360990.1 hypothetical protein [Dyadobacter fermentans]
MNYLEWNNIIAEHLFNPAKAGKDVYIYVTKEDVINLGKNQFEDQSAEMVWQSFIGKIKSGLPGSAGYPDIIDKATHVYSKWKAPGINKRIDGIELKYPPYVAYLAFLVMPLVDILDNLNSSNYYDRLGNFLSDNNVNQNLRNRLKEIETLWSDLSSWANIVKNGEFGYFRMQRFTHQNWVYVGKMFSQCVFPPKAVKKLPELFLQSGMIPGSNYSRDQIKGYLLKCGSSILHLPANVIDVVRKSDTNELGQSIIETVRREYCKWTGESHSIDETGHLPQIKRNDIASRIYLQFRLLSNTGKIDFSFRLKTETEFPEDLTFNNVEIHEEKAGYSKTLYLPFKPAFQIKDDFNRWIATHPDKDVRLFIGGGLLQLSNDYWIETDTLSRINWMYLLCKKSKCEEIKNWLEDHCQKYADETDYIGMPSGYSLFKFLNPKAGLDTVPELGLQLGKSIQLVSALKYDFRTFTNDYLPEVEIQNSDGSELVYLQYKHSTERVYLKKGNVNDNLWSLPKEISLHSDFNIRIEDEDLMENETTYKIISTNDTIPALDDSKLPKRNSFGQITDDDLSVYAIGSNTIGSNLLKQELYIHIFKGKQEDISIPVSDVSYQNEKGNILLSFLTSKGAISAQEFYAAFDFIYSKSFDGTTIRENINYSKIKKASLNYFDYLGYLDYEYSTNSVVINPPQFVFLPAAKGRKVLLIGGRNASLVNAIIDTARQYELLVEVTPQLESNEEMLLPDAITIRSFGNASQGYGERRLIEFSNELGIKFSPTEFVQVSLQQFCSDVREYEADLLKNRETTATYMDWARYLFDPDAMRLQKSYSDDFDKSFALLEYRLRPWEFHHRLWVKEKCYIVEKNWAQYIALKNYSKQVILKGNGKVGIPLSLPLPRLLAESILLCSGIAPAITFIGGIGYRVYENIPSIFIDNLFYKLGQQPVLCSSL